MNYSDLQKIRIKELEEENKELTKGIRKYYRISLIGFGLLSSVAFIGMYIKEDEAKKKLEQFEQNLIESAIPLKDYYKNYNSLNQDMLVIPDSLFNKKMSP